jgi:hypothetical protein
MQGAGLLSMPPGDRWACARVTKPLPAQTARQIAPEALIPPEIYSVSFHDPFHAWLATAWHARFHSESPGRPLRMDTLETKIMWP